MTILTRFLRPWRALKCISSSANRGLHHPRGGPCQNLLLASTSSNSEFPGFFSMSSLVFLAGSLGGMGFIEIAHAADANEEEETSDIQTPPTPTLGYNDAEKIVRQERLRIEELLKNQGLLRGSYPPFTVAFKGQKVTVKFRIPPTCEVSHLIASLVSHLGLKAEGRGGGSDMLLRAWESTIAWQLILNQPKKKQVQENANAPEDKVEIDKDLCILVFQSLINSEDAEIEFIKEGSFSLNELEALVAALKLAGSKVGTKRTSGRTPRGYSEGQDNKTDSPRLPEDKSITALEAMGVRVFGFNELHSSSSIGGVSWENIAGYDMQKREIEDTILLALHSPEVYDDIARGTRCKFESNRARAVLFEGPPGTGKTSCARVIANQAGVPLLYVPLEVVMSKYYGESERLLGNVFSLANELSEGALIFLDEVDSFAIARDDGMHEATRRILSVLLRQIDGFEQEKKVVVIAATNRKEDLDPALISRFDSIITFELPDQQTREQIAAQYAKHLKKSELVEFAKVLEEMSGRDIRDVCQQAERRWASKIIRGQARTDSEQGNLPPLQEYIESALDRQKALLSIAEKKKKKHNIPNSAAKEMPLAFL